MAEAAPVPAQVPARARVPAPEAAERAQVPVPAAVVEAAAEAEGATLESHQGPRVAPLAEQHLEALLAAVPDPGWAFDGWSGDLTGNANPAGVTMDRALVVTATILAACSSMDDGDFVLTVRQFDEKPGTIG